MKPSVGTGTRIDEISFLPPASPVTAVTVTQLGDVGARVGDELLGAVDHPVPVVQLRRGPGGARVGAAARLGQAERAQRLAACQAAATIPASAPRCRSGTPASRPARRRPPA